MRNKQLRALVAISGSSVHDREKEVAVLLLLASLGLAWGIYIYIYTYRHVGYAFQMRVYLEFP